jgi:ethanolamine ammonia-lyase small subunit
MTDLAHTRLPGLRALTPARVALPTVGNSIATREVLAFQAAHALARDAVHAPLDMAEMERRLQTQLALPAGTVQLRSNAGDRATYLRAPHLGRTLDEESAAKLAGETYDLVIVIADGLSSKAVERNALPVLQHLVPALLAQGWTLAPIALVQQGRVAIGDPIGQRLHARCSLVLIGERPGLSCATSLGAYITWQPRLECTDANRVCLSNIHEMGLQPQEAAAQLLELLQTARVAGRTGAALSSQTPGPIALE